MLFFSASIYDIQGGNKGGHGGHGGPHSLVPGDNTAGAGGAVPHLLADAERTSLLAPDIDDEDEAHHHLPQNASNQNSNMSKRSDGRPPVYRDDLEEGAAHGSIELTERGTDTRKNEATPVRSIDLLDLQVEPSAYNELPPESEQSV